MKRNARVILSTAILALLSALSCLLCKGALESLVDKKASSWATDHPTLYTSELTQDQKAALLSSLSDYSNGHQLLCVSTARQTQQSGASIYTFGVLGSAQGYECLDQPFAVLGSPIVSAPVVQSVMNADEGSYAGFGNDASKRVATLPSIRAGAYFRVQRISSADDFGDACVIYGLDGTEFQELLSEVASASGVDAQSLTARMTGSARVPGLLYASSIAAFLLLGLVYCLCLVTWSLMDLKELGVYLMLGWSKKDFVASRLHPHAKCLMAIVPVGLAGTWLSLDGFAPNPQLGLYAVVTMVPSLVVALVSMAIAAVPLLGSRPVDAIAGRYSRKGFYALCMVVFVLCVCALFGGCIYMDQPLAMYKDLAQAKSIWSDYQDWYVMQEYAEAGQRYTGNTNALQAATYQWYASHQDEDGVYLAKTSYISENTIRAYSDGSADVPPFWYLAASPTYLRRVGIDVSDEDVRKAHEGVRVYLLPDSMGADDVQEMQQLLQAKDKPFDSDIVTRFMSDQRFEFLRYDGSRQLFTWAADSQQPATASGFVICVVTAENMVPFESESLGAMGLDNCYVKLSPDAASRLLDDDGVAELGDGPFGAKFATVTNYIEGIQKSLSDVFALFSVVIAMLVVTIAILVACLVEVVNRTNAQEMAVRCMLGFGVWDSYKAQLLSVSLVMLAGMLLCLVVRCRLGVLLGAAVLVACDAMIWGVARRRSVGVVLEQLTKE